MVKGKSYGTPIHGTPQIGHAIYDSFLWLDSVKDIAKPFLDWSLAMIHCWQLISDPLFLAWEIKR